MAETPNEIIIRYLQDAIAAEKNFETQLRGFANEGDDEEAHRAFSRHAEETRTQYERLTSRLEQLGGSVSNVKSFLAHVFGMAPKAASLGHDESERVTQNLMIAYAVENSEVAMYESLATAAAEANDSTTELLAREIQQQERDTAQIVWKMIPQAARRSFAKISGGKVRRAS